MIITILRFVTLFVVVCVLGIATQQWCTVPLAFVVKPHYEQFVPGARIGTTRVQLVDCLRY